MIKSEWRYVRWEGGEKIVLSQLVTEGPKAIIGKIINLDLYFEQIELLIKCMENAKKQLKASQERIDKINRGNNSNED